MRNDARDQRPGQLGGGLIAFVLREVALEDRVGGALAELGLEDRGEGESAASTERPDSIGLPVPSPVNHHSSSEVQG